MKALHVAGGHPHPEGLSKRALEARLRLERVMPSAEAELAEAGAQAHAAEEPHAGAKLAAAGGRLSVMTVLLRPFAPAERSNAACRTVCRDPR